MSDSGLPFASVSNGTAGGMFVPRRRTYCDAEAPEITNVIVRNFVPSTNEVTAVQGVAPLLLNVLRTAVLVFFAAAGTAVLGVSADPVKAQEAFRNKHQLSIPLISDETHEMLQAYRAWGEKSMYGRTFLGVLRTTVLIDAGGRIARIWHGVKVDGHADAVLEAAREL